MGLIENVKGIAGEETRRLTGGYESEAVTGREIFDERQTKMRKKCERDEEGKDDEEDT